MLLTFVRTLRDMKLWNFQVVCLKSTHLLPLFCAFHGMRGQPAVCVVVEDTVLRYQPLPFITPFSWSFLWILMGGPLFLLNTKHLSCHVVPSVDRNSIETYCLTEPSLTTQLGILCARLSKLYIVSLTDMKCGEDNSLIILLWQSSVSGVFVTLGDAIISAASHGGNWRIIVSSSLAFVSDLLSSALRVAVLILPGFVPSSLCFQLVTIYGSC